MTTCCQDCFRDPWIREIIGKSGESGACGYCGAEDVPIDELARVGQFIRGILEKYFVKFNSWYLDRGIDLGQSVRISRHSVLAILRDDMEIFSDNLLSKDTFAGVSWTLNYQGHQLLDDLLSASAPVGEQDALLGEGWRSEVEIRWPRTNDLLGAHDVSWETFKYYAKHYCRYFDPLNEKGLRETILEPIADCMKRLEIDLPIGTTLWRSRVMKKRPWIWVGFSEPNDEIKAKIEESRIQILTELGPPPFKSSRHNRMSPAGISYMYVADNKTTCISEIRPNIGDFVWTGKFETTKSLRIVDLTTSRKVRPRSIFDPAFTPDELRIPSFLANFESEISRHILPDDNILDYVPSQVICEYIRFLGYDGIGYRSSLFGPSIREGGESSVNYVLFCGPSIGPEETLQNSISVPRLPHFTDWMRIRQWIGETVREVRYTTVMAMGSHGGGDVMGFN